ncbi:hypothetical protein AMTRI_Chr08g163490 [Amborella trichopoda]
MFLSLVKRLIDNLLDFDVPCADLFKAKVINMAHKAREVLYLEESASIEEYPSIRPLLRFFPGPLTITDSAVAQLPSIFKEIACFENEEDMAILERNIGDLQSLFIAVHEVGKKPFLSQLVRGEYPHLVKNFALLQAVALKDRIKWAQQDHCRLSFKI